MISNVTIGADFVKKFFVYSGGKPREVLQIHVLESRDALTDSRILA